ncbi:MAG: AAA family ATPase [Chitinispirillales bacterium]|jgi:predicted AAA+ superfamily ATPase|nr:AAA family ATPase [Chitinispirillales bacterium]
MGGKTENSRYLAKQLLDRIAEKRHMIQVVVGPRQVGKTTLCRQILFQIKIMSQYHTADAVAGAGGAWIDGVWEALRVSMKINGADEALLVIDEIQKVEDWSEFVKKNWDADTFNGIGIKLIILGSSRLLITHGLSESLFGRFELNVLGHWSYSEMRDVFGFTPERYAYFGAYPGTAAFTDDEKRFKEYIRDSIIESVVSKDILQLTQVNKPAMLRQLANIGISYSAQIVSYNKILDGLDGAGNTTTLSHYMRLLDEAGVVCGLQKYSKKSIIQKQSIPKFQVHNQSLLCALLPYSYPEVTADCAVWGRFVESAVGTHLIAEKSRLRGGKIGYWRKTEGRNTYEVDFVFEYNGKILGIEVKSGAGSGRFKGFGKFKEYFPEAMTLVVGRDGIPWEEFVAGKIEHLF